MFVEFNVKNLFGKIPVTSELNLYYEQLIKAIAEKISSFIDTSNVEKIVVPNDFIADVVEYQRLLNMENPSVTNNEFGRAFGKILYDKNADKYVVFIDPNYATFLMEDTLYNVCFNNLDEEYKKNFYVLRQQALNLLAHELIHAEFASHAIVPEVTADYESQVESLLYQLFDEYYACRRSTIVSSEYIISYDEKYINEIEQKIIDEKWKYKTHQTELNEFCLLFHSLTKQCLIGMVSVLGSLEGKKTEEPLYKSCRLGFLVDDFRIEFDKMYVAFLAGNAITMPPLLAECINQYFDSFGVYISERPEGMYYHIPN
ncbi:hypothetical protein E4100_00260 [Soehngenia longivitae]|uniref:Uncharacterized protein n=1 Tax=Soehngenia longivitae TaxID=2562294 RepID=A0A4Z0D9Q2_9FIRM|nr:hypothetical protein [Soehngenia longivitae]TFZ41607.1 hypothetical protein E4100_00260 [Soehngenia longivitae]